MLNMISKFEFETDSIEIFNVQLKSALESLYGPKSWNKASFFWVDSVLDRLYWQDGSSPCCWNPSYFIMGYSVYEKTGVYGGASEIRKLKDFKTRDEAAQWVSLEVDKERELRPQRKAFAQILIKNPEIKTAIPCRSRDAVCQAVSNLITLNKANEGNVLDLLDQQDWFDGSIDIGYGFQKQHDSDDSLILYYSQTLYGK